METFDAIHQRRAIKGYDPEHALTDPEITQLMEAAMQAPTSFNMQNWRFVLVRDKALRAQLRAAAYNQAQVTDASLLIIMTADLKAWQKQPERYWRNAPAEVAQYMAASMVPFYDGRDQLQRDEAMRSCGLAGQTIMLAAMSMGYDSCPMIGFEPDKFAELINLPADHVIAFIIAVGKGTRQPWPKPGQLPLNEVVVYEKFA